MGWFDRAKKVLLGDPAPRAPGERAGRKGRRPDLPEVSSAPSQTIEDALAARDAGDREGARRILQQIDQGAGLRTLMRAAAALEAGDDDEVVELLPTIAADDPPWRFLLQIASAISVAGTNDAARSAGYVARARADGAPAWALSWTLALSHDEAERRQGLVELLFADAALARTVAARDLALASATADARAAQRYAAFAHGRETIRRFGVGVVATVVDRARGFSAAADPAARARTRI